MRRQGVCLMGYGETPFVRPKGGDKKSTKSYMAEAIKAALDNAGLKKKDVNGLAISSATDPDESAPIAEYLGLELDWILKIDLGGASGIASIRRAADNIQLGENDVIVCVGADIWPENFPELASSIRTNYQEPLGWAGPNGRWGMIQRRAMNKFGITLEQLGKIAMSFRKNAELNEHAILRSPMEIDDYLNSRSIADPLRLFDCCMMCSGACAVVVASEQKAKELTEHPVYLVTDAEKINYKVSEQLSDITLSGFIPVGAKVFSEIRRDEIAFCELYDATPVLVAMQLVDFGFCQGSELGQFIESHDFTIHGDFPINTGGGQLSGGQPTVAGGHSLIVEAVRQLKGEAGAHQVRGAKTCLVTGRGGTGYVDSFPDFAAMILRAV